MDRVLEAIFRRPLQLLILSMLPVVISLTVVYFFTPRSYQSTAELWAFRRYEVIGATGPESDLQATPAETQATAVSELLQSRNFALSVAHGIDLVSTLNLSPDVLANPQRSDDAMFNEVSHQVQAVSLGYDLYTISYANHNPVVAQQIVAAVIEQFSLQSVTLSVNEGQHLLDSYKTQLTQAKHAADQAAAAEVQYLVAHPGLTKPGVSPSSDPQYAQLEAQRVQTQNAYQNLQTTIDTINQQISTQSTVAGTFFEVLDPPLVPLQSLSRTKTYLTDGGVGLGIGILVCIVYVIVLVRRDHAIHTVADLQRAVTYPVVMQLPHMNATIVPLLIKRPMAGW